MERFPLDTAARYDYASRFDPRPGGHHGIDIFAPMGTPLVAVESGAVWADIDPKGGNVIYILNPRTRHHYYYAHLRDVDPSIPPAPGRREVEAGELVGHLGDSGNAAGTSPHLHFQFRDRGTLVDPYAALRAVDPGEGQVIDVPPVEIGPDDQVVDVPEGEWGERRPPGQPGPIVYQGDAGGNWKARGLEIALVGGALYLLWMWSSSDRKRRR